MDLGIVVPVLLILVVVPLVYTWARNNLKDGAGPALDGTVGPTGGRLTSNALRELQSPPWRVVYEIADDQLGAIEHVVIGPPGVFAVETTMDALPPAPVGEPAAQDLARDAIVRGDLDDLLGRCAMTSDRLVRVHWGTADGRAAVETLPGTTAVDGRELPGWLHGIEPAKLTPAQVDLAWQTVLTGIGRPDPLA